MRFTENSAFTSSQVATDDILPMTDVSTSTDKKITFANLSAYVATVFAGTFGSATRTIKNTLDYLMEGRIDLDTNAGSATTDGKLYAAIVGLGWQSDVID